MGVCASAEIQEAHRSKILKRNNAGLAEIPLAYFSIHNLEEVWLQGNAIRELPAHKLAQWSSIELCYMSDNQISALPPEVAHWSKIEEANFSNNNISALPPAVGRWVELKQLYLNSLKISALPKEIASWTNLKVLHMNNCCLTTLPEEVSALTNLVMVALNNNHLSELPAGVERWAKLEKLFLNDNQLSSLPPAIRGWERLEKLYVNNNLLTKLPAEIGELCDNLDELYVLENSLAALPEQLCHCAKLNKLYLHHNQITALPQGLSGLRNLEILHVGDNKLTQLPPLYEIPTIKFIHANNNKLNSLQEAFTELKELRVFDVEGNLSLDTESLAVATAVQANLVKGWDFSIRTPSSAAQMQFGLERQSTSQMPDSPSLEVRLSGDLKQSKLLTSNYSRSDSSKYSISKMASKSKRALAKDQVEAGIQLKMARQVLDAQDEVVIELSDESD